eukprot:m.167640 g.167640  ORF g.167640 m.167640 type:complete len:97 (+) comp53178_c0_seq1:197-487(+)
MLHGWLDVSESGPGPEEERIDILGHLYMDLRVHVVDSALSHSKIASLLGEKQMAQMLVLAPKSLMNRSSSNVSLLQSRIEYRVKSRMPVDTKSGLV